MCSDHSQCTTLVSSKIFNIDLLWMYSYNTKWPWLNICPVNYLHCLCNTIYKIGMQWDLIFVIQSYKSHSFIYNTRLKLGRSKLPHTFIYHEQYGIMRASINLLCCVLSAQYSHISTFNNIIWFINNITHHKNALGQRSSFKGSHSQI